MQLKIRQLNSLFQAYAAHNKIEQTHSFKIEFIKAVEFIKEEFDEYINLAAISTNHSDYNQEKNLFYRLLDHSLNFSDDKKKVIFSTAAAIEKTIELRRNIDTRELKLLHGQSSNLGIQEKYLKGTLGTQEWLSEVDLKRMLVGMGWKDEIHISRFNALDIGVQLHFAREKQGASIEPYSIPFLLNKGSEGRQTGSHWFTVAITVDPSKGTISYFVEDSIPLSNEQKKKIERIIEKAIYFQQESVVQQVKKEYKAFPGKVISEKKFANNAIQKDGFSCGYRALHALLNYPCVFTKLVKGNIKAEKYANLPRETTALVSHIYNEQLGNMEVKSEILVGLGIEKHFNKLKQGGKHKLKESKRNEYVGYIGGPPKPIIDGPQVDALIHPSVTAKLNEYTPKVRVVSFPVLVNNKKPLAATDHELFYLELHKKLNDQDRTLDLLALTPCDPMALDGLIAFSTTNIPLRIDQLEIDISRDLPQEHKGGFIVKLKTLLPLLSEKQLKSLKLTDMGGLINESQWKEIATVVKEKGITIEITLPTLMQLTHTQRDIDRAISTNKFNELEKAPVAQGRIDLNSLRKGKPKRIRPRPKKAEDLLTNLTVDVELQQEQQVEVQFQRIEIQPELDRNDLDIIKGADYAEFSSRLQGRNKPEFRIPNEAFLLSDSQTENLWKNWFGYPHRLDATRASMQNTYLDGITREACEQLLKHKKQFQFGFDQNHLPAGFAIIFHPLGSNNRILHFDSETAKLGKKHDLLAPVLKDPPKAEPLAFPIFEELIELQANTPNGKEIAKQWEKIINGPYDRQAVRLFQRHLPTLMTYQVKGLKTLFTLCTDKDAFNKEKFAFILDHSSVIAKMNLYNKKEPAIRAIENIFGADDRIAVTALAEEIESNKKPLLSNILVTSVSELQKKLKVWQGKIKTLNTEALLQVYSQRGAKGLEELFDFFEKTNLNVLNILDSSLLCHAATYMPLLDPMCQATIKAITSLKGPQKKWWEELIKLHGNAVGYDDLPSLFDSFNQFVKFVEAKGLKLYPFHKFKEVESLPVVLGRMTTILSHCKKEDLQLQWNGITELDLGPAGAIVALTDAFKKKKKCTVVVPEMQINPNEYSALRGYEPDINGWKDFSYRNQFIDPDYPDYTEDQINALKAVKVAFFKAIAYQEHRMPMNFYYTAFRELEKKKFWNKSPRKGCTKIHTQLVALLYGSTTGEENKEFLDKSIKESLKKWQYILNNVDNPPLTAPIKILAQTAFFLKKDDVIAQLREGIVEIIYNLKYPPALPLMNQLFFLIINSFRMEYNLKKLQDKFEDIDKLCNTLKKLTQMYGNAIYEGMLFYTEADFNQQAKDSIFHRHIAVATAFVGNLDNYVEHDTRYQTEFELMHGVEPPKKTSLENKYLISMISTYQIKLEEVDKVKEHVFKLKTSIGEEGLNYALKLLSEVTTNEVNKEQLNSEQLGHVLQELAQSYTLPQDLNLFIEKNIEAQLGAYYEQDFFKKLQAVGIEPSTVELIREKFNNNENHISQIIAILSQFNKPGESTHYNFIVQQIAALAEHSMHSASEIMIFLNYLSRNELYQTPKGKLTIDEFKKLLEAILARGHAHDFIYFLSQDAAKDAPALNDKTIMYLKTMLPALEGPRNRLSKKDLLPLVCRMLLGSTPESLTSEVNVTRKDEKDLNALINLLRERIQEIENDTELDLKTLEMVVTETSNNLSGDFESLNQLVNQLHHLNEPLKPEPTVFYKITSSFQKGAVEGFKALGNGFLGSITHFFGMFKKPEAPKKVEQTKTIPASPAIPAAEAIPKVVKPKIDKVFLVNALEALSDELHERATYRTTFADLFKEVNRLTEQYPGAKGLIIEFVEIYIDGYDKSKGNLIIDAWNCVTTITEDFTNLHNTDVIRSLCYHFSGTKGDFTPANLLGLMNGADYKKLSLENKRVLLTIASVLLNNEKQFNLEEFRELIVRCNEAQNGASFLDGLRNFYSTPPYPDLKKLDKWHQAALLTSDYTKTLNEHYATFDKHPCEREIGELDSKKKGNGFDLGFATNKLKEFSPNGRMLLANDLEEFSKEIIAARELPTADLIKAFQEFRNEEERIKDPKKYSNVKLVALAAELLYRSKGNEGPMGSSFEINTTQYLAILGALNAGTHNTSEIGTGEGKSRIMAIANACQFGLSKTVDFVTSEVQLATRDYLEYQSYFGMLGAKTNIITADIPASEYCIGGINYSDASNLQLFRNKANSTGNGHLVIDPDKKKRALMLDEADKTYFDCSDIRYNFSTQGDESLTGMEWIYPLLIQFFAENEKENENLYYDDVEKCNEEFMSFVRRKESGRLPKLKAISQGQLETWLESAYIARALVYNKKYAIETDVTIETPWGPKKASDAKLIAGTHKAPHSKFSFGVHQCLHAYLNLLKSGELPPKEGEAELVSKLEDCNFDFNIDTEKQIIYSSSSKNLLDEYGEESTLIAVTGTIGSIIEQQEASHLYSMEFINVPRHNGLQRVDKAVRLTANAKAQVRAIVDYLVEFRNTGDSGGKPSLIICEDDRKSKAMFDALIKALRIKGLEPNEFLQHISNDLTKKQQNAALEEAKKPGMVTVSTGMIGRGTDIKLASKAIENGGLEVMGTYMPRERDMMQFFGRSGRAGQTGGARLVLDKQELKRTWGKISLKDGFYTATETYIKRQQALMDRNIQCERLVINVKYDFDKELTDNFFERFKLQIDPKQRENINPLWMSFIRKKDEEWMKIWSQIKAEMEGPNPNTEKINVKLAAYQKSSQALWDELRRQVEAQNDLKTLSGVSPVLLLKEKVRELQLDKKTENLLTTFEMEQVVKFEVKVYDKYDPAHDGRAIVYSRSFEKLRAVFRGERNLFADIIAWANGAGILFPNLRAWWNGHMTFKQFVLGSGDTPSSKKENEQLQNEHLQEETRSECNSSYQTLLKKKIALSAPAITSLDSFNKENPPPKSVTEFEKLHAKELNQENGAKKNFTNGGG